MGGILPPNSQGDKREEIVAPKVFVIHGRDEGAHSELSLFIRSLGLEELTFDDVAHSLGANPFIADVVDAGVKNADLVIALFTPDEHAALYSVEGRFAVESARWQARPNVIFEAGWSYGRAKDKTILVTLGADVTLFSDVSGIHFIRLDHTEGKAKLRNRLAGILKEVAFLSDPPPANWLEPKVSGDFVSVTRVRWKFYDELDSLERRLQGVTINRTGISLLWILLSVAAKATSTQKPLGAYDFMRLVLALFEDKITDTAYWELIISGFLEFLDVGYENEGGWGLGGRWQKSAPHARVAPRGEMLLAKLAEADDPVVHLERRILELHKVVRNLSKQRKYKAAQEQNSRILNEYPHSPRAHFNQARISAQLGKMRSPQAEQFLQAARQSLASAIDYGYVKLLVLTGDPEERQKPLQVIQNDVELRPLFNYWPDVRLKVADAEYLRGRGWVLAMLPTDQTPPWGGQTM